MGTHKHTLEFYQAQAALLGGVYDESWHIIYIGLDKADIQRIHPDTLEGISAGQIYIHHVETRGFTYPSAD